MSLCQQDPQLRGRLDGVMTSVARAVRIGRGQKVDALAAVRPELFQQDEERVLHDALQQAASKVCHRKCLCPVPSRLYSGQALLLALGLLGGHSAVLQQLEPWHATLWLQVDRGGSVADFISVAETLVEPINAFFDKVFVMTEEADVRTNRQALLRCGQSRETFLCNCLCHIPTPCCVRDKATRN